MKLTYLGHSAFELGKGNCKILIDPFLVMSPDYLPEGVTDIFVTHAHGDHLGSAIDISKKTGATITAVFELANHCANEGAKANGIGLGSWLTYPWGRVIAVPAFHSSSIDYKFNGGCPCGFIFDINGTIIYHAGDTALTGEMKTIGELYQPDIALLPIGGHYTMDIEHAVKAAEWLEVSTVVPMHYNTFEQIKTDVTDFERQIRELGKLPLVLGIKQSIEI
ncbi:MAG: metal-dependent hydrolase [Candidatus Gastranaerophilales bacterium]|nr:metal-dependent hydrolase [Candidatus Gastranaerophilales bacterium]MCM1073537.1 metal-dependent hydrolase [Bacteroides sp.]